MPAANIYTDAFAGSVRGLCPVQGMPEYPSAHMPHPLAGLGEEALRQRVAFIDDVVMILQEGRLAAS